MNAFGSTDEIYVLPTGPRRGYVKFRDHRAAEMAVEAGFGCWSESERVLSSQRSKKNDGTVATYPDSIIARLVGSRGDGIKKLQEESGAAPRRIVVLKIGSELRGGGLDPPAWGGSGPFGLQVLELPASAFHCRGLGLQRLGVSQYGRQRIRCCPS